MIETTTMGTTHAFHCFTDSNPPYQGPVNTHTAASTLAMSPTTVHRYRTPMGTARACSNLSGKNRFTKKTSANKRTIEVHQMTVTAA